MAIDDTKIQKALLLVEKTNSELHSVKLNQRNQGDQIKALNDGSSFLTVKNIAIIAGLLLTTGGWIWTAAQYASKIDRIEKDLEKKTEGRYYDWRAEADFSIRDNRIDLLQQHMRTLEIPPPWFKEKVNKLEARVEKLEGRR